MADITSVDLARLAGLKRSVALWIKDAMDGSGSRLGRPPR